MPADFVAVVTGIITNIWNNFDISGRVPIRTATVKHPSHDSGDLQKFYVTGHNSNGTHRPQSQLHHMKKNF